MSTEQEMLLAEARRRGLLPPAEDPLIAEARRRGLLPAGAGPAPPPPPTRMDRARDMAGDYMGTVSTGLAKGVGNLVGLPETLNQLVGAGVHAGANLGRRMTGRPEQPAKDRDMPLLPSASQATGAVLGAREKLGDAVGADLSPYRPDTAPGRVFQDTVAAMVNPGSLPANLGAGAGASAAGELTRGTRLETPARIVGGLVGGLGPGVYQSLKSTPQRVLGQAAQGMTPEQLARAEQIQQAANALGTPVTGAEAIGQAVGGAAPLAALQRVVEQSRTGGPIMNAMMSQRSGRNQDAMARAADAIGPAPAEPGLIPGRVQQAAEGAVKGAEQARTAAVTRLYEQAKPQTVPADRITAILDDIDQTLAADKTGLLAPKLGRLRDMLTDRPAQGAQPRVPVTDIENLDRARKYMRDSIDLPPIAAEAVPKEVASALSKPLDRLRTVLEDASPEFRQGKATYQQISKDVVEPLQQGPVGTLAETRNFGSQAQLLLPRNPDVMTPAAAAATVRTLQKQDPAIGRDFVRQYLTAAFNRTNRDLVGGENTFGGAKFRAEIVGNPEQKAILQAVIQETPGGKSTWKGFETFLDVLQAQGRRAPANSATEFNKQITAELSGGRLTAATQPLSVMQQWYDRLRYGQNADELARLLTAPDSVRRIKELAILRPSSARANAVVSELLVGLREGGPALPSARSE